jgi:hypothetical protein
MKNASFVLCTLLSMTSLRSMDSYTHRHQEIKRIKILLNEAVQGTPSEIIFKPISRIKREHRPEWYRELYFGQERDCGFDSPTTPNKSPIGKEE